MAHVSQAKKQELKLLTELFEEYPTVGILDLTSLPSAQFQKIKADLKGKLLVRVTKKRLIKLAIEKVKDKKQNIEQLKGSLENCMPGLLFTREEPFKISKLLNKSKTSAPAKAGQIAPKDIIAPAGLTKFPPGPVMGDLGAVGIKCAVENGKIAIKQDHLLIGKGKEISQKISDVLGKLEIKPMEIGLNLVSVYDEGLIYPGDILSVDEKEYIIRLQEAYQEAINLAVFSNTLIKETVEIIIAKANAEATAVAAEIKLDELTIGTKITKEESNSEESKEGERPEVKEENKSQEEVKKEPKEEVKEPEPSTPETLKEESEPEEPPETEKKQEKSSTLETIKEEEVKGEESKEEEKPQEKPKEETEEEKKEQLKETMKKPQMEYNEDMAKKAQDLINQLKDKEINS